MSEEKLKIHDCNGCKHPVKHPVWFSTHPYCRPCERKANPEGYIKELEARIEQLEKAIESAHYDIYWDVKPSRASKILRESFEATGKCLHRWERKSTSDTWTCSKCKKKSTDSSLRGSILHDKINFFKKSELSEMMDKHSKEWFKKQAENVFKGMHFVDKEKKA